MNKRHGEVVGFTFQEIPLDEARQVVLAGDGNYSAVKQKLLETLPNIAPDKAFAFGLPNGKDVPEDSRRGLCMSISMTLKKARLNWKITYSSSRKLFICVPRLPKGAPVIAVPKRTRTQLGKPVSNGNGHSTSHSPTELINTARLIFNYKGDFKDMTGKAIRKAISVVGMNDLGIHPKDIAPLVCLTKDGVYYNAHNKTGFAQTEIKALQKAVQEG